MQNISWKNMRIKRLKNTLRLIKKLKYNPNIMIEQLDRLNESKCNKSKSIGKNTMNLADKKILEHIYNIISTDEKDIKIKLNALLKN